MTMTTTLRGAVVSQVAEKLPSRALPPPLFPRQVRVGLFIAETERRLVSFAIITWNWTQSRWCSLCAAQEGDSDSEEVVHPQQQNRTRQKKFVKNFKQLPSEEVVLQREYRTKRNDKRGETNARVLLRPDVGHSTTRPPLCHWKLHRLPLKRLWLCHQSNWSIIIFVLKSLGQMGTLYIFERKTANIYIFRSRSRWSQSARSQRRKRRRSFQMRSLWPPLRTRTRSPRSYQERPLTR